MGKRRVQAIDVDVAMQRHVVPVIEAGAFQRAVVHSKAGNADDVQMGHGRGAKPGDISSVRRYLGFDEGDMEHLTILVKPESNGNTLTCIFWPAAVINSTSKMLGGDAEK